MTESDLYFCLDADCFICRDMHLVENGKPRLFMSPNGKDEAAFHRFISRMSGGELCSWRDGHQTETKYIADMQLFDKKQISQLVLKYFPSANDFVHFTIDSTYWRADDTEHSMFISEYEMYGLWVEKTCRDSVCTHLIEKRQIDRN